MKLTIKFFDKLDWSIPATLQTFYILLISIIIYPNFKVIFSLKYLVFASIISMIQGQLLPKTIFIIFLAILTWIPGNNKNNIKSFLTYTTIIIIATLISNYLPVNRITNKITNLIENNKYLTYLFKLLIFGWFILISYLIYLQLF